MQGSAEAEIDGVAHALGAGEHVFVPLRAPKRVRNTGAEALVIIEVQTGEYLDEHDIIRLSDDYGRR